MLHNGIFVKNARGALDLSQSDFAERLGLGKRGKSTVSDWELGKREISPFYLAKIKELPIYSLEKSGEKAILLSIDFALTFDRLKRIVNFAMQRNMLNSELSYSLVTKDDILLIARTLIYDNGQISEDALPYSGIYSEIDVDLVKKFFKDFDNGI